MAVGEVVGSGKHTYEVDKSWGRRDGGVPRFGVSQGVSGDSKDRVYVFQRSPIAQMMVFDRDGKLLNTWGEGKFLHPHGVWVSPSDELYLTDRDAHTVSKWTLDGKLLQSWGTHGQAGAPGAPFNQPTKAVLTPDGEMYVSDGYGQHRVHRFGKDGKLISSWGEKGEGDGQFALPHDVWVDDKDRVLICDRENKRVQLFDRAGTFTGQWRDLKSPMQIFVRDGVMYMAEAGHQISIRTVDGEEVVSWSYQSVSGRDANSPHSIWVDSRGDIYVGEVTGENGFQKFVRQ
jgi:sugar lactone lactonase YvrE